MSCGCIRLHSKPKEISFVLSRFLILFLIVNSCFAILLCISVMWFIVKTYKRKQVDMTKLQCIFSFLPLFILVIRTTNSVQITYYLEIVIYHLRNFQALRSISHRLKSFLQITDFTVALGFPTSCGIPSLNP